MEVSAQTSRRCAELLICLEANIRLFWESRSLPGLGGGRKPGCHPPARSGSSSHPKCSPAQFVFSNKERLYLRVF